MCKQIDYNIKWWMEQQYESGFGQWGRSEKPFLLEKLFLLPPSSLPHIFINLWDSWLLFLTFFVCVLEYNLHMLRSVNYKSLMDFHIGIHLCDHHPDQCITFTAAQKFPSFLFPINRNLYLAGNHHFDLFYDKYFCQFLNII